MQPVFIQQIKQVGLGTPSMFYMAVQFQHQISDSSVLADQMSQFLQPAQLKPVDDNPSSSFAPFFLDNMTGIVKSYIWSLAAFSRLLSVFSQENRTKYIKFFVDARKVPNEEKSDLIPSMYPFLGILADLIEAEFNEMVSSIWNCGPKLF
jgi:hypothetical protein